MFENLKSFLFSSENQKLFLSLFIFTIIICAIFISSIIFYIIFYYNYIPRLSHKVPCYFQYINDTPTAEVSLVKNKWKNSGILTGGQYYNVYLTLDVEDSKHNYDIGNFMVQLLMINSNDKVIADSNRPGIVKYKSFLHRNTETIIKMAPLLVDIANENQKINLPLFEEFIEDEEYSTTKAVITLSTKQLHLNSAVLNFEANFHGLRYYMYHWKIPTGILLISIFMLWETIIAFFLWRSIISFFSDINIKKEN